MKHDALIAPDESQFAFGTTKISGFAASEGGSEFITVPDAHLLFSGDFKRSADDLKIVGDDGKSFLVTDYFKSDKHPTLRSPEGATLSGDLVDLLAGPLAPGQYAQAGAPQPGAEAVGRVAVVTGNVTVIRNGVAITVNAGDAILKNDVVQTGAGSTLGLTFNDGSTFNLSANARLAINEFVYDPNGAANSSLVTLIQGAATFVAGQVAKSGDMKVATPVATMGIRGTAVMLDMNALDGRVTISIINERDGKEHIGEVFDRAGNLIATVTSNGGRLTLTPTATLDVIASFTNKTVEQIALEFAAFQAVLTSYEAAKQFFPNLPDRADATPKGTQNAGGSDFQPSNTTAGLPDSITQGQKLPDVVFTKAIETPGTGDGDNAPGDGTPTIVETVFTPPALNPIFGSGFINGTDGADYITGSDAPDTINAMGGDDFVFAMGDDDTIIAGHGGGDDFYDGGTNNEAGDTIKFESATLGVTIDLDVVNGVLTATADGEETGHDDIVNVENFVGGSGDDVFVLHTDTHWELDGGAGFDIIRITDGLDFTGDEDDGPTVHNIEMVDLDDGEINVIDFEGDVADFNEAGVLRVIGNVGDVINLSSGYNVFNGQSGHWVRVGEPRTDTAGDEGLFSGDHHTDGVEFQEYEFVDDNGCWIATAWIDTDIDVTGAEPAQDDTAGMTENQVLFVDALANDSDGGSSPTTLTSLGTISIDGPDNVTLGFPAIVIENNQIRITPGTAFDALAEGETATITIPYTMQNGAGETASAVATITVTGTNDAPAFSTFPQGFETIGSIDDDSSFGGTPAVQLITNGADSSEIETFLGLSAGALVLISQQDTQPGANRHPTNGAAIAFDLDLAAGETVTFTWNFASTEYEPYADFAFFSFAPAFGDKLADIFAIGDSINDGVLHSSGWQQYSFTAEDAGQHRLGIGVVNTGDTAFDSLLYISGFTGLGFSRQTTEDGTLETFDLLNGAFDVDTNDILVATNVAATAHNQGGESVDATGAIQIEGNNVTIDPTFFDYLAAGEFVTVTVNYDISDGHTTTHNSATLVVNGENDAPSIDLNGDASGTGYETTHNGQYNSAISLFGEQLDIADIDSAAIQSATITASLQQFDNISNGLPAGLIESRETLPDQRIQITITGLASLAVYEQALAGYAFQTGDASLADREITLVVQDASGASSNTVTTIVHAPAPLPPPPPPNEPPVISVESASTTEEGDSTTLSGLTVSDTDEAPGEQYTVTAVAQHGSVSLSEDNNPQPDVSFHSSLEAVNNKLAQGVTYTPGEDDPDTTDDDTDMVTLTVMDANGASDTINFVFDNFSENGATLSGDTGKDMIFSTGGNDQMIGHGGQDIFVFSFDDQIGDDTINGFHAGAGADMDKILLDGVFTSNTDPDFLAFLSGLQSAPDGQHTINFDEDNTITLQGVDVNTLQAANFIIHPDQIL